MAGLRARAPYVAAPRPGMRRRARCADARTAQTPTAARRQVAARRAAVYAPRLPARCSTRLPPRRHRRPRPCRHHPQSCRRRPPPWPSGVARGQCTSQPPRPWRAAHRRRYAGRAPSSPPAPVRHPAAGPRASRRRWCGGCRGDRTRGARAAPRRPRRARNWPRPRDAAAPSRRARR